MASSWQGPAQNLILFYDALCPLCRRAVKRLEARGLLESIELRPTDDATALGLAPEDVEAVRSEMLLRDTAAGRSYRGFEALLKLAQLHGRYLPWLTRLGSTGIGQVLGGLCYRLVAYNRRILSPPATRGLACVCDPPSRPAWRVGLLVLLVAALASLLALFGAALAPIDARRSAGRWIVEVLLVGGAAYVLPSLAVALVRPSRAGVVLWQGLVASVLGAAWLGGGAVVALMLALFSLPPRAIGLWTLAGIVAALAQTAASLSPRYRNLGLAPTLVWIVSLGAAGIWLSAAVRWGLLGG